MNGTAESHDTHINTITIDDVELVTCNNTVMHKNDNTLSAEFSVVPEGSVIY